MLAAEPQDQFLRYSLAIEFDNEARHEESLRVFSSLLQDSPPHVPAFFARSCWRARPHGRGAALAPPRH
jgi:hypothetical protein